MRKQFPSLCPACHSGLKVTELSCTSCDTKLSGNFPLPELLLISPDEQQFILDFIIASGSLKLMAKQLQLSYPTVRNRLDDIILHLNQLKNENE